ncbi:MAG: NADH:ubiquinone reductase (Na(+)-transporting) subunit C [Flavobacteriales bacterium]|nr:NADH:ubiquinone reductase (Na(+)-transporting) subunit C [Flavobacteriales bacterium]
MDKNSNKATFIFATIMVIIVGTVLAFTAEILKPFQAENVRREKMQNILMAVKVDTTRDGAEGLFNEYIKEQVVLNSKGEKIGDDAFNIKLKTELKKDITEQQFPLYLCEKDGEQYYIVEVRGKGLWGPVWGYIALEDDMNTVFGATFDHKGETPGLGAEITTDAFQNAFIGKKIMEGGEYSAIVVVKGNASGDHQVDALSGATITSVGVSNMIGLAFINYLPYFKELKK